MSLSPFEKAVKAFQEEYAENNSVEVPLSKAEFNDLLYKHVSKVIPLVTTARRKMVERGLLIYPNDRGNEKCVLYLSKIKSERF